MKGFFHAKTNKEVVLMAMEYWMKNKNINYYKIYHPYIMLKKLQKEKEINHFVYKFLTQLKFL